MQSLAKLTWQCRRGTKELDALLLNYLQTKYPNAKEEEQQFFQQLLDYEDAYLLRFLLDNQLPDEPNFATFIKKIRTASIIHH